MLPTRALPLTIYYGERRFLLLAESFTLDRRHAPYRRLAATLLIARHQPFTLELEGQAPIEARAVLLAPKLLRRHLRAEQSEIAIFDFPMDGSDYQRLAQTLSQRPAQVLDADLFAPLFPLLQQAAEGQLDAHRAALLHRLAAATINPGETLGGGGDTRVAATLQRLASLPLEQVSLTALAQAERLSPSRLSHLFRAETGSTVSHYARWVAVWRAVNQWQQGRTWTRIAQDAGFHDLAHLDHAFIEVFGLKPSAIFDPSRVALHRLGEPET